MRLPFASSNMPSSMFYSCVSAEVIRIGRVSTSFENFMLSAKSLLDRSIKQGAKTWRLVKTLKKVYGRHELFKEFVTTATVFVNTLIK